MSKYYIIVEDDWELMGNGLGNVASHQYVPALSLVRLAERFGIKPTFMVETAQQLTFRNYADSNPNIKIQKELWDKTVKLFKKKGFDVQLHLHPQWMGAEYEDGFFYVTENWNIGRMARQNRVNLLEDSINYLTDLVTQVDTDYEIHSFKAGGWGLQPSQELLEDLKRVGIKQILGVRKGYQNTDLGIDYQNLEEDTLPYYPKFSDITHVDNQQNGIVVVPLSFYKPSLIELPRVFYEYLKSSYRKRQRTTPRCEIPSEIEQTNKFSIAKRLSFPFVTCLKLGGKSFKFMKLSFDKVIERLSNYERENVPIIIESHSKNFPRFYEDNYRFFEYVTNKYGSSIEFITLSTLWEKIENGEIEVQSCE